MAVVLLLLVLCLTVGLWRVAATRRATGGGTPRPRFVAPDDDPDFLRDLDMRTRRPDDEPS